VIESASIVAADDRAAPAPAPAAAAIAGYLQKIDGKLCQMINDLYCSLLMMIINLIFIIIASTKISYLHNCSCACNSFHSHASFSL
jgi:hypothetical protein